MQLVTVWGVANLMFFWHEESARVALCAVGGDVEKAMRLVLEESGYCRVHSRSVAI